MQYFDVIIIGAGPAGLNCAKTLGDSNYTVLVLEKNSEIGPKICAGGLTKKSIISLNLPKQLYDFKSNKLKIHASPFKFILKDKKDFIYSIDRKNFGKWQLKRLKQFKNIKVRTGANVSKIENKFILVNGKKILYKFLVGADGSSSLVRNYLGIQSNKIDFAVQYIIQTRKYKFFEIFFNPKLFSAWYAWIFPHGNYVSIGCGCNPDILSPKDLIKNFNN